MSSNIFKKSQSHLRGGIPQEEELEPWASTKSRKGKEVVREVVEEERDMDMEVDVDMDAMDLSYPDPVPPPPVSLPMGTSSAPSSSSFRWKAANSREYRDVSVVLPTGAYSRSSREAFADSTGM